MIDDGKEYIACAAVWYDDGSRHHFQSAYGIETGFVIGCFRHPYTPFPTNYNYKGDDVLRYPTRAKCKITQGFITSYGRFVGRKEAATIAKNCGQAPGFNGDTLYSEDIFRYQKYRAE